MKAALYTEIVKVMKSKIFIITFVFFGFIGLMTGFLMLAAKNPEIAGNSEILSTKASLISSADWPSFLALLLQMAAVLSVLGPGIVTTWIFGREYSDRVIKDILALPVSRLKIITAKLVIVFVWSLLLLVVLAGTALLFGLLIKLDGWSPVLLCQQTRHYFILVILTILLVTPIALITSISRGYLLPVGLLILILIFTQFLFVGAPGIIPFFPWAIPALFSGIAGHLNPQPGILSIAILLLTSILGYVGTVAWWMYADQH